MAVFAISSYGPEYLEAIGSVSNREPTFSVRRIKDGWLFSITSGPAALTHVMSDKGAKKFGWRMDQSWSPGIPSRGNASFEIYHNTIYMRSGEVYTKFWISDAQIREMMKFMADNSHCAGEDGTWDTTTVDLTVPAVLQVFTQSEFYTQCPHCSKVMFVLAIPRGCYHN